MKEINDKFNNQIPIIPVIENNKFFIVDTLYNLGMHNVCFNFKPDVILKEIKEIIEPEKPDNEDVDPNRYLIDFYENKGTFIIDITGFIKKEKISPLKLMFQNFLRLKLKDIKCVLYIFSDVAEESVSFDTVWTLFRIWKEIGIKYKKIGFLSSSERLTGTITKYFQEYGVQKHDNLLEAIKTYYPEMAANNEMEVFEFSASLLQSPNKLPNTPR